MCYALGSVTTNTILFKALALYVSMHSVTDAAPAKGVGEVGTCVGLRGLGGAFCTIKIKCGYILHDAFFAHCLLAFVTKIANE